MGAPVEQELPIIQIRNCLLVSIQTELHDRLAAIRSELNVHHYGDSTADAAPTETGGR